MTEVIVVGAGSAGGVVATRLCQQGLQVDLVEAGPDYGSTGSEQPQPVRDARDLSATDWDWGYHSEPSRLGRRLPLYAGKIIGGSSATNNVMALRGHPADYDAWATAGNPGWEFETLLTAFTRLERDLDYPDDLDWHGRNGPIAVHRHGESDLTPPHAAFLTACIHSGFEQVEDHNVPGAVGVGPLPLNEVGGVRQSTALTYLAEARTIPTLRVRAEAEVTRVLIESHRAVGVETAHGQRLHADYVVLCAGAYGTPEILLRSGIGPADQLRRVGLPVHQDLPGVGANLHDHPLVRLTYPTLDEPNGPPLQTLLTTRTAATMGGPDLQIFPSGPTANSGNGENANATLTILVALMTPTSRGQLRLTSPEPHTAPTIDPGYLQDQSDLARLVTGLRLAGEIATTAPLEAHLLGRRWPGPNASDAELEHFILGTVAGYQHPVGTCRMGPSDDPDAVVDHAGHVYGIDQLGVIDASIMPKIPSANANLAAMMLAEHLTKAASPAP
jgi:choline dehydrogenase